MVWCSVDSLFFLQKPIYSNGKMVFLILGLMRIIDMLFGVNGQIINISKLYRFDTYSSLVLALVAIFANYLFIPQFGINGAALATAISVVLFNLVRYFFVYNKLKIQPFDWNTLKVLLLLTIAFIFGVTIPKLNDPIADTIYRSILISILFGGMIYFSNVSEDVNRLMSKAFLMLKKGLFKKR